MLSNDILSKYLWEDIVDLAKSFNLSEDVLKDMSDFVDMILRSKSIDSKEEKQNWIDLLSVMNEDQLKKLKDILTREKEKLKEIEEKYEQKKTDIKKKYLAKWQQMWYVKKVAQIEEKEREEKSKEDEEAEELLSKI